MKPRTCVLSVALLAAAGCNEPLVFADWTLPVEEGTRILEYAHVPVGERDAPIDGVEELVIGDRGDVDLRYAFTRPRDVAVDARGQIYVVDPQAAAVKVFDAAGEYLRELGRQGQGPGEFQDPRSVASFGDLVIVGASRNARWSHFDLDGNHLVDYAYPIFDNLELVRAADDSRLIGSTTGFTEQQEVVRGYGIYSPETELIRQLVEITSPNTPTIQRGTRSTFFSGMPHALPTVDVSSAGVAYWSMSDEYQVLAIGPDGEQGWALRVALTPEPLSREAIDDVMERVHRSYEDATESEVTFPDRFPAIRRIQVDGHGHVYVFPYTWVGMPGIAMTEDVPVPVDVYSSEGDRLFTGMSPQRSWAHADGDYVWEIGTDPDTEENVVRKIRLVEPFE